MNLDPLRILMVEDDEDDYILVRDLLSETAENRFHLDRRIGITLQPVEQLLAVGPNDVHLRKMHVAIDESRNDQVAAVVSDLDIVGESRHHLLRLSERSNMAVLDHEQPVRKVFHGSWIALLSRIAKAMQDRCAERLSVGHCCYGASSIGGLPRMNSSQLSFLGARSTMRNSCPASSAISGMCQTPL